MGSTAAHHGLGMLLLGLDMHLHFYAKVVSLRVCLGHGMESVLGVMVRPHTTFRIYPPLARLSP